MIEATSERKIEPAIRRRGVGFSDDRRDDFTVNAQTSRLEPGWPEEVVSPKVVSKSVESYFSVLKLAPKAAFTSPPGIDTTGPCVTAFTSAMLGDAPWIEASFR